jgi:hypothetical protein
VPEMYVDHATPSAQRAVTSYKARHGFHPGVVYPPAVPNVTDAIDLHAHCHGGQQDPLALAKVASQSGMLGIVFKTIGNRDVYQPAQDTAAVAEELNRWADVEGIRPIHCWAGYVVGSPEKPSLEALRKQLEAGVRAVWLPVNNHANSYFKVGARGRVVDPTGATHAHTDPLPWEEALKYGLYMLDEKGKLLPLYADIIRLVAEHDDVALFFGHATHPEIAEIAELLGTLKFRRGVIDHPFSPFLELTVEMMRDLSRIGVRFNFTFDELSPLIGVDPAEMYKAIRDVGVEHCTLSSDGGEPLFPHSVECVRLIRAYMSAFGMNDDELYTMCTRNPSEIVGMKTAALS